MSVEKQIAIIYCGTKGLLKNIPVNKIRDFEEEFLHFMELHHEDALDELKSGVLSGNVTALLEKTAIDLSHKYQVK
jgi:F-type H+-transporting ATPase subunit alpha